MPATRTNISSDIDGALAGRNAGSEGFWEVARSGNGNMTTDLMRDDTKDYTELEGVGEAVEEMTAAESAAVDAGQLKAVRMFRNARPDEVPPHAPKPGKAWIRRRIPIDSRRPGGVRLVRVRWVQVSPKKWADIQARGQALAGVPGIGILGITRSHLVSAAVGAALIIGGMIYLKKRRTAA